MARDRTHIYTSNFIRSYFVLYILNWYICVLPTSIYLCTNVSILSTFLRTCILVCSLYKIAYNATDAWKNELQIIKCMCAKIYSFSLLLLSILAQLHVYTKAVRFTISLFGNKNFVQTQIHSYTPICIHIYEICPLCACPFPLVYCCLSPFLVSFLHLHAYIHSQSVYTIITVVFLGSNE